MDAEACRYNRFLDVGRNYRQLAARFISKWTHMLLGPQSWHWELPRSGSISGIRREFVCHEAVLCPTWDVIVNKNSEIFDFSKNRQNDLGSSDNCSDSWIGLVLLFRILDLVCEMDAWACRYNRFLDVGGNYRQFFFEVFSVGECFAPLPDRLGRFTSGQEQQVVVWPSDFMWCEALSARGQNVEK